MNDDLYEMFALGVIGALLGLLISVLRLPL